MKTEQKIIEIEYKKSIENIDKTKSWFFERNNKFDNLLARLTKKEIEKTQIIMSDLRGPTVPMGIKRIIK